MSDKKIKSMVMAAVMAALTYVATTVIKIPAPPVGMSTSATGWCCCAAGSWGLGGAAQRLVSAPCWWTCWADICPSCPAR